MNTNTIDKIVNELKNIPEEKISSLLDYLHFLQWETDESLSSEEENLIKNADDEIQAGKGINWRKIKRDV